MNGTSNLLEIRDLKVYYNLPKNVIKAVDGVNLHLEEGDVLGLIGESGSGKSTLGRAIIKLLPPYAKIVSGKIFFEGEDIVRKDEKEMRKIRGGKISMIFQDPSSSLNPCLTIGEQIAEVIKEHCKDVQSNAEIKEKVIDLLNKVGIMDAKHRFSSYPHELSIGMRQRVVIAMALAASPKLVIADEPTSSLDVSTQAKILELIKNLKTYINFSMILITHHIGVASSICNRIAVMYGGKIIEIANREELLKNPSHPYTLSLLNAVPYLHRDVDKLFIIQGKPPDLSNPPPGCRFHPRCSCAESICKKEEPPLTNVNSEHAVACFRIKT
ncbi:MAG: ABC transporter ATP-binding protein [Desulfurococcaceae archaeon]